MSRISNKLILKNMAIDDVLPLKAARCDAIANLKWFLESRDTSDLISMVLLTSTMRRHLIGLASGPLASFPLAKFGFRLPCATADNEAERRTYGGWMKTPVLFSPVCGQKFTKFSDDCRRPLVLFNALT